MNKGKVKKIDFSRKRFAMLADKYYNQGKYFSALRMAMKEFDEYGGGGDVYARLSDIYEAMNLQGTAINWWFKFLHVATEADLPDVYEGLAINYLNLGNDSISAYYYNRLIDVDDTLPDETKLDIAEAFSTPKKSRFRFVYPPQIADFSQEVSKGSKSLKTGDLEQAIEEFSAVEKGSKQYPQAKEMQAVAYLLAGNTQDAESACNELLQEKPDDVRGLATLAAVYLEQGRKEESLEIAKRLAMVSVEDTDDIYKIATVCCENGLHEEAYKKFCILDQKLPFDGRTLYFKGVSAYKSGLIDEAEKTFATLCDVYPDAEVAKFYLKGIRNFKDGEEPAPELTYFYHLPEKEREARCETLMLIRNSAKDEAELFGMLADTQGYFRWCFDEMDG
ncbi:MAG: tetratricopeptide repeat protein, partial [Clostridia bacterium]|nr:tetratricopeptide repeat protein [Clostridia bacterium]